MKRGLKALKSHVLPLPANGFKRCPDEEGTERVAKVATVYESMCFKRCPDEEGTERIAYSANHARCACFKRCPDEEGTEREQKAVASAAAARRVSNAAPMKRGLKGIGHRGFGRCVVFQTLPR